VRGWDPIDLVEEDLNPYIQLLRMHPKKENRNHAPFTNRPVNKKQGRAAKGDIL